MRTDNALKGLKKAKKHALGFSFESTSLFLTSIDKARDIYFFSEPIFNNHPTSIDEIKKASIKKDNSIYNLAFDVYGLNFRSVLNEFRNNFTKKSLRKLQIKMFSCLWKGIYVGWLSG